MSKRSSGEPTGGPSRPQGHTAGQPRLESLLRLDVDDDPDQGSLLYQAVVGQDTTQLSSDGWLDRLDAIGLVKSRLAALEAVTIAGFDDSLRGVSADLGHRYPRPGDRDATPGERRWIAGDLRSVSDEIALTLGMHRGSATTRIHRSCELVHNFPATLAALSAGLLTERAAFTIVSELSVLDNLDDLRAAEAAILDWAGKHPLVDIKKACQREVARRSPAATDKAHQRAHDERSVRMYPDDIGRATLVHDHGAVDSSAIMTSLSRAAIRLRRQGDPRSMDQLRNDIALSRLLPRTKSANHDQAPATSACTDDVPPDDATGAPADDDIRRPDRDHQPSDHACADQAPDADEPPDDSAYDPLNDYDQPGDNPAHDQASSDDDATTSVGAEATVVIHATGAEVRA
ncbi:MAG: hypothetical protein QOH84_6539, partial [Kribbellaceae bacterium]|nr:hypothetical protein [Kribbellaceae bacterium]